MIAINLAAMPSRPHPDPKGTFSLKDHLLGRRELLKHRVFYGQTGAPSARKELKAITTELLREEIGGWI
jgi:hypothetical protein